MTADIVAAVVSVAAGFAAAAAAVAPRRLKWVSRPQVVALTALAAAATASAVTSASATGTPLIDALYRALIVGVTTSLGSRVGLRTLSVVTMATMALSAFNGGAGLAALAAVGAVVGWRALGRRAGAGRNGPAAVTAACCALSLVQPGATLPTGQSALAAGVILSAVVVLGYIEAPGPVRRRIFLRSVSGLAFLGVAAVLGVIALAEARPSLDEGVSLVTRGVAQARELDGEAGGASLRSGAAELQQANDRVRSPRGLAGTLVPLLGQQLRTIDALSAAGADLAGAGAGLTEAVDQDALRLVDGRIPLERLRDAQPKAAAASSSIAAARATLGEQASPWLLPQLTRRLIGLESQLGSAGDQADLAAALLEDIPPLLGSRGPRRYFVVVQSPSELRGSGGFMGSFVEIAADDGRLTLARTGRTRELNADRSTPVRILDAPADFRERYAAFDVATTWQNVTISPHFPSDAQVIRSLYPQSGGRPVDAVMAIDPFAIQAILKVVGPIQVEGAPAPLTGDNAARVLLYDQYRAFADDEQDDRRDFLAGAIGALAERAFAGAVPIGPLAEALRPMVEQKHLMISAGEAAEDPALARLGITGAMAPLRGDSLAVVVQNAGSSKIDWFLRRKIDYEVSVDPAAGAITAQANIQLTNGAPASGLPRYLIGNDVGLPPGTSRLYVSIYSPLLLKGATIDGEPLQLDPQSERGRMVYSTYVNLPAGASRTLAIDLAGRLTSAGQYRLDLHRQPSAAPDQVTVSVGRSDGSGRPVRREIRLLSDTVLRAPLPG